MNTIYWYKLILFIKNLLKDNSEKVYNNKLTLVYMLLTCFNHSAIRLATNLILVKRPLYLFGTNFCWRKQKRVLFETIIYKAIFILIFNFSQVALKFLNSAHWLISYAPFLKTGFNRFESRLNKNDLTVKSVIF